MLKLKPDELTKPFRSTLLKILAHKSDETDDWLDAQLGAAGTDGSDIAWRQLVSCSGGSEKEALLLLKKSQRRHPRRRKRFFSSGCCCCNLRSTRVLSRARTTRPHGTRRLHTRRVTHVS